MFMIYVNAVGIRITFQSEATGNLPSYETVKTEFPYHRRLCTPPTPKGLFEDHNSSFTDYNGDVFTSRTECQLL